MSVVGQKLLDIEEISSDYRLSHLFLLLDINFLLQIIECLCILVVVHLSGRREFIEHEGEGRPING